MSMIAVCDGCGKQQDAACHHGNWFKPGSWFERTPLDAHGKQERNITACSRRCIELAEDKRAAEGKARMTVVLPI
jgi:hypothetical protein